MDVKPIARSKTVSMEEMSTREAGFAFKMKPFSGSDTGLETNTVRENRGIARGGNNGTLTHE